METVRLPDGYNGDYEVFRLPPAEIDGSLAKVYCETNVALFRWVTVEELEAARKEQK